MNGKKNGEGKDFNELGDLIFIGQYINSERKGIGKEFDIKGDVDFEGYYFYGNRWYLKGIEYNENSDI